MSPAHVEVAIWGRGRRGPEPVREAPRVPKPPGPSAAGFVPPWPRLDPSFAWAPADGVEAAEGTATPATCGNGEGAPVASGPQEARGNADLSDVLWIGGAIGGVLVAALVTFLVVTRKKA